MSEGMAYIASKYPTPGDNSTGNAAREGSFLLVPQEFDDPTASGSHTPMMRQHFRVKAKHQQIRTS
jgi:hypothetical protein